MYIHASKFWPSDKIASVAKNSVWRCACCKVMQQRCFKVAFWLSNTIVLREIIAQIFGISCQSTPTMTTINKNGSAKRLDGRSMPMLWKNSSSGKQTKFAGVKIPGDCQETSALLVAWKQVESWIFSRIVETVWWQTTFQDAFNRICPLRAAGHQCGCLPVLAKLVMEQCVARLDVAMFNAILRESASEMPTDPISDPIVDPKVLPIPAGDLCFGSGAQLKNSIGNWSRWLTDNFGMEADDSEEDSAAESKSFELLNELSDLLMLPKGMLVEISIRKEVICPSVGLPLVIIRILCNFTPDEFCPDPVPSIVLEELNSESLLERCTDKDATSAFPCIAAPVVYRPPLLLDVAEKVRHRRQCKARQESVHGPEERVHQ
ncbi:hypothetical protein ABZP36_029662 [Zizania latifolia]